VHALDPKDPWTLANRGLARVWKQEYATAVSDLDAAAAIDGRNPVVFRARGRMARQQDRLKDAVAAFNTALEIEPRNGWALANRGEVFKLLGDHELRCAISRPPWRRSRNRPIST
jgi:tetratricopeptide (TPR) repeat protein